MQNSPALKDRKKIGYKPLARKRTSSAGVSRPPFKREPILEPFRRLSQRWSGIFDEHDNSIKTDMVTTNKRPRLAEIPETSPDEVVVIPQVKNVNIGRRKVERFKSQYLGIFISNK